MRYGHWLMLSALTVSMVAPLSGCGDDNDSTEFFLTCGDGVVNSGEQCDDGNTVDTDGCLTSCLTARCGDGFIRAGAEECDGNNLASTDCTRLGLQAGTLRCSATCSFDTSGCGGGTVPTVTPTPGAPATATPTLTGSGATATPTPTVTSGTGPTATPGTGPTVTPGTVPTATATPGGGSPTPTPTATATGPVCASGDKVTLALTVNIAIGGVQLELLYPASARIPGTGADPVVAATATFPPGLVNALDQDTDGDLVDDRVDFAWASQGGNFTDLATVEFECVPGQSRPTASAFTCTINTASDDLGQEILGAICTVSIP